MSGRSGRLSVPLCLGLGVGFSLSLALVAAKKSSLFVKIVVDSCNLWPHIHVR